MIVERALEEIGVLRPGVALEQMPGELEHVVRVAGLRGVVRQGNARRETGARLHVRLVKPLLERVAADHERARGGGGVAAEALAGDRAMLRVIEPEEIQPWAGVEATMTKDALDRARAELADHEKLVESLSASKPEVYVRKGRQRETLMQLLQEEPHISVLVLAAQTGDKGPGPLISYLMSAKGRWALRIPVVIVPDTYEFPSDNRPL